MPQIKPQVNFAVKHGLVERVLVALNNPPMKKGVGQIIKERLKSLRKTQGWLAEQLSVSDTAVSKWIQSGKISRENAIDVARVLGVSLDDLLKSPDQPAAAASIPSLSLVYVDPHELRLLTAYREANPLGKALIEAAATSAPKEESLEVITTRHKS